jgi:diacylglycerol kinase (ATP)
MRYGIVVNPIAGKTTEDEKRRIIAGVRKDLGPDTLDAGWDTHNADELGQCARDLATKVDVLVVAGGDGTLSDIINAVDPETVLSHLPMGSGNAWRKTLGLPRPFKEVTRIIKAGREHRLDLILCDGRRKALFASIGIDGHVLSERAKYLAEGVRGFDAYFRATTRSLLGGYKRKDATLTIDDETLEVPQIMSLMITKTRFYGYGFEVVPRAKPDDGLLHVLAVSTGFGGTIYGIITSFLGGNRVGEYRRGKTASVTTEQPAYLQIDGTLEREGKDFKFELLAAAITIRS